MYFDSYATGKRIQHLRKAKGMTQEELAIKLNISDRQEESTPLRLTCSLKSLNFSTLRSTI